MTNFLYDPIETFNKIKKCEITNELKNLDEICNNILSTSEKRRIINIIKEDLLNDNQNISILELESLSNNIFDYICLSVKKIDVYKIDNYIIYKNTINSPECKNNNLHLLKNILIDKKLKEKYFKLINEKIIK